MCPFSISTFYLYAVCSGYTLAVVEVMVSETQVRLELTGWDRIWAFKHSLTFSHDSVAKVFAEPRPGFGQSWWKVIRAPGASVPGVIQAGTFYFLGRREFSCVHFTGRAVVFELDDAHYTRIVVDVRDPEAVVQRVRAARWGRLEAGA